MLLSHYTMFTIWATQLSYKLLLVILAHLIVSTTYTFKNKSVKVNQHFFSQMNYLFCYFIIKLPFKKKKKKKFERHIATIRKHFIPNFSKSIILNQSDVIDSQHTPINLVNFWSIVYKSLILNVISFISLISSSTYFEFQANNILDKWQ